MIFGDLLMAEPRRNDRMRTVDVSSKRPQYHLTYTILSPVEIPSGDYHQVYDPPITILLMIDPHDDYAPDKHYFSVSEITVVHSCGAPIVLLKLLADHRKSLPEREWYVYINCNVYEFQLEPDDRTTDISNYFMSKHFMSKPNVICSEQYIYSMPFCLKLTDAQTLADEFNEESDDVVLYATDMVSEAFSPLMSSCRAIFMLYRCTAYTVVFQKVEAGIDY